MFVFSLEWLIVILKRLLAIYFELKCSLKAFFILTKFKCIFPASETFSLHLYWNSESFTIFLASYYLTYPSGGGIVPPFFKWSFKSEHFVWWWASEKVSQQQLASWKRLESLLRQNETKMWRFKRAPPVMPNTSSSYGTIQIPNLFNNWLNVLLSFIRDA